MQFTRWVNNHRPSAGRHLNVLREQKRRTDQAMLAANRNRDVFYWRFHPVVTPELVARVRAEYTRGIILE